MSKPLFAYFGTPTLSTVVLDSLEARGFVPALVITAPDKPAGRGLEMQPSPTKRWALERDVDVVTPEKLTDPQFIAELSNTDWDVFVVAMYAKLIPKELLDMPQRGVLNVHPSLLPKFRGPSPVLSAILADERETGVSIMQLTEGMDEGPVVAQARIEIEEAAWPLKGSQMETLLAQEGGNLLAELLPDWVAGSLTAEEQDGAKATYTKKFDSSDALLDLTKPREAFLKIRAFDQSPRAYFIARNEKRIIVTEATWTGDDIEIVRVIPEGKKEMLYSDYLRGQN